VGEISFYLKKTGGP